ncbi:MAG: hypothetical protein JO102_01505 [Elusimicrobia bacterium]|nr:hypothetical protein [Elusimicrobiota bacterium]
MRPRDVALLAAALLAAPLAHGVDTTIKGGRMEILNKGGEAVFTGGVKLDRGTDEMRAEEMRTNRERDKISAKGNVSLFRQTSATETWRAYGESGFYDTKTGDGYLVGKKKQARVIRTEILSSTATRQIEILADRIDFAKEGQRATAKGLVYGKTVDPDTGDLYVFESDQADYQGDDKQIILTGADLMPLLTQTGPKETRRVTGEKIIYYIDSRRLISEGSAQAVLRQEK